VKKVV
jgi:hypothetical protein